MSDKLRAIVVDDESLARQGLNLRLKNIAEVEVIGEYSNGREAVNAVAELRPDLLFLDIQMPGMSGFDVVERLQQDEMPLIIFTTAYDQYAIEAFKVHAVDYLLKPIETTRLQDAIYRAVGHKKMDGAVTEKQRLLELIISITGKSEGSITQLLKNHTGIRVYPEKIAIKDAKLQPNDVNYINAHGTSTPQNDLTETLAIKKVFGENAFKVPISSTKSMIGHALGGAGALEAVASVKTIQTGKIHPTINYSLPDSNCDLDYVPNVSRKKVVDTVLSNSFGFGGQNACIIISRFDD